MPPHENVCIWLVSGLFFLLLTAGGALLVLYVALPDSDSPAWLPVAGLVLVGIPWLFWIVMCVYRSVSMMRAAPPERPLPVRSAAVAPASDANTARASCDDAGAEEGGYPDGRKEAVAAGEDGGALAAAAAGGGSFLASHESERPLAHSMS